MYIWLGLEGLGLAWSAVVLSKVAMMSGLPSLSRSAVMTEVRMRLDWVGRPGRVGDSVMAALGVGGATGVGAPKVPSPWPGRSWAWVAEVVTMASRLPEGVKLPRAALRAGWLALKEREVWRVPSGLPKRMAMPSGESRAMSGTPSLLKSATT